MPHNEFLRADDVVDATHPAIAAQAAPLARATPRATAQACFEWVRDYIDHSFDAARNELPCTASAVLATGASICTGKSHLLVALLRANRIPAGLVYQRLYLDSVGGPYCTHGLVALWLDDSGWYRCDARGNRPGIDCQFTPGSENLAFKVEHEGERLWPEVWAAPWPELVAAMRATRDVAHYKQAPIDVGPPAHATSVVIG